jgi:hypothetical protein
MSYIGVFIMLGNDLFTTIKMPVNTVINFAMYVNWKWEDMYFKYNVNILLSFFIALSA